MAPPNAQRSIWRLAAAQHGVITRKQLLTLGFGPEAIRHRVRKGRLHRVHRGVYAVGRPQLTQHGIWMAAALGCGPEAGLSHESAGALWGLRPQRRGRIEVSVPMRLDRGRPGLIVHRRARLELTRHLGIPLTDPALTLVDLATRLGPRQLEAAVNEADALNLITPGDLRAALERWRHQPGAPRLRAPDVHPHGLRARAALPPARPEGRAAAAGDREPRQRVQGGLPLGRPRPRRRDGRPALPPDSRTTGQGSPPRSGAHARRTHPAALHAHPGPV